MSNSPPPPPPNNNSDFQFIIETQNSSSSSTPNYDSSSTSLYSNHYSSSTPVYPNYDSSSTSLYSNHYSSSTPVYPNYDSSSTSLLPNNSNENTIHSSSSTPVYPNHYISPPLKTTIKLTEYHKNLIKVSQKDNSKEYNRKYSLIYKKLNRGEIVDENTDLSPKNEDRSNVQANHKDNPNEYRNEITKLNRKKINSIHESNPDYKTEWDEIRSELRQHSSGDQKELKDKRGSALKKFNSDMIKAYKRGLSVKIYRERAGILQQSSLAPKKNNSDESEVNGLVAKDNEITLGQLMARIPAPPPPITTNENDTFDERMNKLITLEKIKQLYSGSDSKLVGEIPESNLVAFNENDTSEERIEKLIINEKIKRHCSDSDSKLVSEIPELNPDAINENDTFDERMNKLITLEKINKFKKKIETLKNK
jgi:hypothetical protein